MLFVIEWFCKRQIAVGTAGPQQQAPDRSGPGTAGPQQQALDRSGVSLNKKPQWPQPWEPWKNRSCPTATIPNQGFWWM